MNKKKRQWMPILLIVLGLLLAVPTGVLLAKTEDTLEYAMPAPDGDAETAVESMLEARKSLSESLMDCTETVTAGAIREADSVSAGDKSITATVYGAGEGWFEVYPAFLKTGRKLSETELQNGDSVVMLDASAAFQLFGEDLNEDSKVTIGNTEYRVVGTFRHSRSVGETQEYAAILPLNAAKSETWTTLMISAKPLSESGARTMFSSAVPTAWKSGGSMISIQKEAIRRLILPRMLLLVFGLSVILKLFKWVNGIMRKRIAWYRDAIRWNYFGKTVGKLLAVVGTGLLGYGVVFGLLSALMTFSIQPVYVFTEWIPDNFVAWSSLKKVFWSLATEHAQLIQTGTPLLRTVEFEGGLLRWGVISVLCGILLMNFHARRQKKTESVR